MRGLRLDCSGRLLASLCSPDGCNTEVHALRWCSDTRCIYATRALARYRGRTLVEIPSDVTALAAANDRLIPLAALLPPFFGLAPACRRHRIHTIRCSAHSTSVEATSGLRCITIEGHRRT